MFISNEDEQEGFFFLGWNLFEDCTTLPCRLTATTTEVETQSFTNWRPTAPPPTMLNRSKQRRPIVRIQKKKTQKSGYGTNTSGQIGGRQFYGRNLHRISFFVCRKFNEYSAAGTKMGQLTPSSLYHGRYPSKVLLLRSAIVFTDTTVGHWHSNIFVMSGLLRDVRRVGFQSNPFSSRACLLRTVGILLPLKMKMD